jgi:hypothetical protein
VASSSFCSLVTSLLGSTLGRMSDVAFACAFDRSVQVAKMTRELVVATRKPPSRWSIVETLLDSSTRPFPALAHVRDHPKHR